MDARIIKTKEKIKEALLSILHTKNISDISISEICKKAKINRNTFYAHFATPEALLDEIANAYLTAEYDLLNHCSSTKEIVVTACEYIKKNAALNLILLENRTLEYFIDRGVNYANETPIYIIDNKDGRFTPDEIRSINTYLVNGAVSIIKEWLCTGMKESTEVIGERVDYITSSLIKGINH